jgi:hypothetical protein
MADNIQTQAGANATVPVGTTIATDQLPSGAHVQLFKVVDGTPDSATPLIVTPAGAAKVDTGQNQPVTDAQMRAAPVPVDDGHAQPLTDAQLRAAALALPTGASTEATLALIKAKTDNLDVALSTRLKPADLTKGAGATDASTLRVITATDGPLNTNLGATNDAAVVADADGSVSAKLRGMVKILADVWDSVNHWLKVQLQASENHIGQIGAHTVSVLCGEFTRPADTTAYAAGDVIGPAATANLAFAGCSRIAAGSGVILSALVRDDANVATKPTLELWLFSAAPTAVADNAAFAPTEAELDTLIAVIPFADVYVGNAGAGAAGDSVQQSAGVNRAFKLGAGTTIYGVLVVRNAYVPVNAEKFNVKLLISQD